MFTAKLGAQQAMTWLPVEKMGFEVGITIPLTASLLDGMALCRDTDGALDNAAWMRYVCDRWFTDFRGVVTEDGQPLPNTIENRIALCQEYRRIWTFVVTKVNAGREWEDEKNGGSGSV